MKKLAAILIIGVWSTIIMATFKVVAKSEDLSPSDFELFARNVPIVCGEYQNVLVYLEYYNFEPIYTSVGKAYGRADGQSVFGMVLYMNKDKTEMISVMGVPSDTELCMMYRTFEVKEFNAEE